MSNKPPLESPSPADRDRESEAFISGSGKLWKWVTGGNGHHMGLGLRPLKAHSTWIYKGRKRVQAVSPVPS